MQQPRHVTLATALRCHASFRPAPQPLVAVAASARMTWWHYAFAVAPLTLLKSVTLVNTKSKFCTSTLLELPAPVAADCLE